MAQRIWTPLDLVLYPRNIRIPRIGGIYGAAGGALDRKSVV